MPPNDLFAEALAVLAVGYFILLILLAVGLIVAANAKRRGEG